MATKLRCGACALYADGCGQVRWVFLLAFMLAASSAGADNGEVKRQIAGTRSAIRLAQRVIEDKSRMINQAAYPASSMTCAKTLAVNQLKVCLHPKQSFRYMR